MQTLKTAEEKKKLGMKSRDASRAPDAVDAEWLNPDFPPPENLDPMGRQTWKIILQGFRKQKILSATDLFILERYCETFSRWRAVTDELNSMRLVVTEIDRFGASHDKINPFFEIEQRLSTKLLALENKLGLNPMSRRRMGGYEQNDKADLSDEDREVLGLVFDDGDDSL